MKLVLPLIVPLSNIKSNIGDSIPGVVDADEQQQNRCPTDDEHRGYWLMGEYSRRDEERGIRGKRAYDMPEPVFQHRLIVSLPQRPP